MEVHVHELAARYEELERSNPRSKRLGLGAAALGGIALLCSMVVPAVCNTVYGERFVLQDSSGNERARITAYETGGAPQFSLLDKSGRRALTFGVAEDGRSYVEVAAKDGKAVRSHFVVGAEGQASIEKPEQAPAKPAGEVASR